MANSILNHSRSWTEDSNGMCVFDLCIVLHQELRSAHSEEIMGIRSEEEMEMSDEDLEENPCKKIRMEDTGTVQLS